MRATPLGSLTAATALALLAPLAPAPAGAAEPADFRATACSNADRDDLASGTATRTTLLTQRLRPLGSLVISGVRLTYANGARCDVVSLDGRLPSGQSLRRYRVAVTDKGRFVVAGADRGERTRQRSARTALTRVVVRELDDEVLGAVVYLPVTSGTVRASADLPPEWLGQAYIATHTRTTASVTLGLRKATGKRYTARWSGELPG